MLRQLIHFSTFVLLLLHAEAVPKRILELMNVEKLTRENVASHLQVWDVHVPLASINCFTALLLRLPVFELVMHMNQSHNGKWVQHHLVPNHQIFLPLNYRQIQVLLTIA